MKVFIRQTATGKFFTESGRWSLRIEKAQNFQQTLKAKEFCRKKILADVEIVLNFGDKKWDVVLPHHRE
jgi:hypothetical protein